MARLPRWSAALLAAGLWALPAGAADLDRFLPGDTNFVLIVNVKQIRSWPGLPKEMRDQAEQLLKHKEVQQVLRGTAFHPLRDVDRVVIASADSASAVKENGAASAGGGPSFVLLEGRFDPAKLQARAEQGAKEMPDRIKLHQAGGRMLVEMPGPDAMRLYAAFLDKNTLMITTSKGQADEALARAAGKAKGELKSAQMRALLAKANDKLAVQWLGSADMVVGGKVSVTSINGKTTTEVTHTTLKDTGFEAFIGGIALGKQDLKLHTRLRAADKRKAEQLAATMSKGLQQAVNTVKYEVDRDKALEPLLVAVQSARITSKGNIVVVEGRGTLPAVIQAVRASFILRSRSSGPEPPPSR
jgi:hypothetical protein